MKKTMTAVAVAAVCASPLMSTADTYSTQAFSPMSADDARTWKADNGFDVRAIPGPVSADDPRTWPQASLRPTDSFADSFAIAAYDDVRMPNPKTAVSADDPRSYDQRRSLSEPMILSSLSDPVVVTVPSVTEPEPAFVTVEPLASTSDLYLIAPEPSAADVLASNTYDLFVVPDSAPADYVVLMPAEPMGTESGQ